MASPVAERSAVGVTDSRDFGVSHVFVVCLVLLAYVLLAVEMARVRPPDADEGNFGSEAVVFENQHYLAMPMLNNVWLPGLDRHQYAIMPLYSLGLAAWFKAFGVGMVTMRLFSAFWGVVALVSWYFIIRALSGERRIAILALILVGLNYDYVDLTSGRYDIMCVALTTAGLAVYLQLRERRLLPALLLSNTLAALGFMTHPYAFFGFVALALFVIGLDLSRIRWKQLVASACPYLVALASWGLYIAQAPGVFREQFFANAKTRVPELNLLASLRLELVERYLAQIAGWRPDVPVYMRVKILILAAIFVSILGCLASREIRRKREYKFLLMLTGFSFFLLTFFVPYKFYGYTIYIWPLYFVLMAIWLDSLVRSGSWPAVFGKGCVALLLIFTVAAVAYRVKLNSYRNAFLPAIAFLQQHVRARTVVMGPGQIGFGLGFEQHVIDDQSLGYSSGETPDYIVVDKEYQYSWGILPANSGLREHIERVLGTEYRLVFASQSGNEFYRIYAHVSS